MSGKGPEAFRTISEVSDLLDVPQHVLRFWETKFAQVKPLKRGGGRRYYRPGDVDVLKGIRTLLYSEGFTIRGVQKIFRDRGIRYVAEFASSGAPPVAVRVGTAREAMAPVTTSPVAAAIAAVEQGMSVATAAQSVPAPKRVEPVQLSLVPDEAGSPPAAMDVTPAPAEGPAPALADLSQVRARIAGLRRLRAATEEILAARARRVGEPQAKAAPGEAPAVRHAGAVA